MSTLENEFVFPQGDRVFLVVDSRSKHTMETWRGVGLDKWLRSIVAASAATVNVEPNARVNKKSCL